MKKQKKFLILCVFISVFLIWGCKDKQVNPFIESQMQQSVEEARDLPENWSDVIGLNLINGYEEAIDCVVYAKNPEDDFFITFNTIRNMDANFVLKIFVNYKEATFLIDREKYSKYFFTAKEEDSQLIKFKFGEDELALDKPQIVSIAIFRDPDKHAGKDDLSENSLWIDFKVCKKEQESVTVLRDHPVDKRADEHAMQLPFSGVMLNQDFNFVDANEVKLPLGVLNVAPGEKVKVAYRAGNYQNTEEVLLLVLLDWQQISINGNENQLITNQENMVTGGIIEFYSPKEAGSYEVIGLLTSNPYEYGLRNVINDVSPRFTLNVS